MSIQFKNLSHRYGQKTPFEYLALDDINLMINDHVFTAIIGHTGSGKSTLIQHINALLLPTEGSIEVENYLIQADKKQKGLKNLRQLAGLVFQFPEYQLFEETIEKDIIFGPMNFGVSESEAKQLAREVIEVVGLDPSYLTRSPFDLSGGQKRRVAIAGILAMKPKILILDEPTAGLDPEGAKEMMELFKRLHEQGTTIILVTHDMDHVLNYADEVIIMQQGKVLETGSVKTIFKNYERLTKLGLELPLITKFIVQLNQCGYQLDPSIKNMDTLALKIQEHLNDE